MNRKAYLFCTLMPLIFLLLIIGIMLPEALNAADFHAEMKSLFDDMMGRGDGTPTPPLLPLYMIVGPFFVGGLFQCMIFIQDESKKWGYFTATHPKGIAGAVYARYVSVFLMSVITMVSIEFSQMLLYLIDHLICGTKPEEMSSYSMIAMLMVFLQIFLRMFDLPFFYRFGKKRGESAKTTMLLAGIILVFIYAMFGPLPGDDFFVEVYDWWTNFKEGKGSNWVYYVLSAFLWVTIIGYYLSYKLSCKFFLKGVEQYDK